jgi:RNA polymerase sigma-70 factor (ECF subfamily)
MAADANGGTRSAPAGPADPTDTDALASFRRLYDEYFAFVWGCARRLGVSEEAIDDVVQDIFIVVHDRLPTLERAASLRSWIYSVIRRTVSTHHRNRRTRMARVSTRASLEDNAEAMHPSPLDVAVLSEELQALWRILGELDAPKREVLMLAELEEMSVPEIAEAVGVPLNTAYSRVRAARKQFDEAFARHAARQRTKV